MGRSRSRSQWIRSSSEETSSEWTSRDSICSEWRLKEWSSSELSCSQWTPRERKCPGTPEACDPDLDSAAVPGAWAKALVAAFEGADWGLAASVGEDASCQTTRDGVSSSCKRTIDDMHVSVSTKKAIMRALARCRTRPIAA